MERLQSLNEQFGIKGQLEFAEGPGGLAVAEIRNAGGRATVALQGAHVMTFEPHGDEPVLWLSDYAKFAPGKSIRGGVPVCWPWFGAHASDPALPAHGYARTVDWQPVASEALADGRTRLVFELIETPATKAMCPHPLRLRNTITVGTTLTVALETTNLSQTPFRLTQALHTYFAVADVRRISIEGLEDCDYLDKVEGFARKHQQGPVTIAHEVDRIYLGSGDLLEIRDPGMERIIRITSSGSRSAVVWNPWIEKAEKMGDFGPDGHLGMVCVETANAADDSIELAPGAVHTLSAEYGIEYL
ncbi:MAG TPA: D-hexose-6-phosphate mutarotase [Mariprofundaceae bacterium]|nr:D-hexose-6-phosphate mutarotase [Mariprofundaceae bacterium]